MKTHLPFFILLLSAGIATAQNPSLVKDINPAPVDLIFYGSTLFPFNQATYFNVNDNAGNSFWRTDGTTQGTYFVAPVHLTNPVWFNGLIYFSGDENQPLTGEELWTTDGTSTGTKLLIDINAGSNSSAPNHFTVMNDRLYFFATQAATGEELWMSDGTAGGTTLVKDTWPGKKSSIDKKNKLLTALGNKVIFTADNGTTGNELYVSDGTAPGTVLLKELTPGIAGSYFYSPVVFNNAVYFFAGSAKNDLKLWKTDGTTAGTQLVKDFNPASTSEKLLAMTTNGVSLFIAAAGSGTGIELWKSDGTTTGTQLLKDINPGSGGSFSVDDKQVFTVINGIVYFEASDGVNGFQPWLTDGTTAGTLMIAPINENNGALSGFQFTPLSDNDIIIFDFTGGLWRSDGTAGGTVSLASVFPGATEVESAISYQGSVLLVTKLNVFPFTSALWKTDGTIDGTQQVIINVNQTADAFLQQMVALPGGKYVFMANDGVSGSELWITDGTSDGTHLLKEITPGAQGSPLTFFQESINGKAFFTVDKSGHDELWVTDGTAEGTKSLNNDFWISYIAIRSAQGNGILYYVVNGLNDDFQLWRSNGTGPGTYNITPPDLTHWMESLTFYNGKLFFAGESKSTEQVELWVSDGTAAGTTQFMDLNPGTGSSYPGGLTVANGKLFFKAYNTTGSVGKLFVSDGTVSGTHTLKDGTVSLYAYVAADPYPGHAFAALGNLVYFAGTDAAHGTEVWQTDGTEAGTQLFLDVLPGAASSGASVLFASSSVLYFATADLNLWATNGTVAGTAMLGLSGNYPERRSLRHVNGFDFFANLSQIWQTDGTACHSKALTFFPGIENNPLLLSVNGDHLFVANNSEPYGYELFSYAVAPPSAIETCNGIDDDCNGLVDDNALVATITPSGNISACDGEQVILHASPTGDDLSYEWFYNGNIINGAVASTLSSSTLGGSVAVVINSSFGCTDTSDATVVNRIPLPKAKITPQGNLDICSTGSVLLKANTGTGYSYQWTLNNAAIPGATKKQYTATTVGNYKVAVTNSDGCSKTSQQVTVFTSCKLMEVIAGAVSVSAYPNPFRNLTHLDLSKWNWEEGPAEIYVRDISGRILYTENIYARTEIEIGDQLPAGFYTAEIKNENRSLVISIVKQ